MSPPRRSILLPVPLLFVVLLAGGCAEDAPDVVAPPLPPPNVPPVLTGEWGEPGTGPGQFQTISDLEIDPGDVVYLSDWQTPRVQRFRPDGTFLSEWPIAIPGETNSIGPVDLALGPDGDVYVLITHDAVHHGGMGWIARFTSSGKFVSSFEWEFGDAVEQFSEPTAIAVDGSGKLYVADQNRDRIVKLDADGTFLEAWTGGGQEPVDQPTDLAWGPEGTLFALARQTHVHEFALDGSPLRNWLVDHHTPEVLAVDAFGLVYTSSQRRNTIERSTDSGVQIEWNGAANGMAVTSDGTILVGRIGSVARYRYPVQ